MAVHARASEHPVALVHRNRRVVVDGRRVPRGDVASLAEHRQGHDQQLILPSRTGMWATARSVLVTWTRWHVAHKAVSVAFTNWCSSDFGWWTLWQVVQERFRRSCELPSQAAWSPRLWHVRHDWLISAGFICANFRMCPLESSSTCA